MPELDAFNEHYRSWVDSNSPYMITDEWRTDEYVEARRPGVLRRRQTRPAESGLDPSIVGSSLKLRSGVSNTSWPSGHEYGATGARC